MVVEIILVPLVNKVVDLAVSFIKTKIDLLQHLNDDVQKLKSNMIAISCVLIDAQEKQVELHQVRNWLGALEKAAHDAEDLLEMFITEAIQLKETKVANIVPFSFSETRWKANAATKIRKLLKRLDDIAKEKDDYGLQNVRVNKDSPIDTITTSFVLESDVVGREEDKGKIMNMLLSENFDREGGVPVIPIVAMGGMGKSTLAQLIYNDPAIQSHFKVLMWVSVTRTYNIISTLKQMIESHSKIEIGALSRNLLESRLRDVITGNTIMVVLDDVWSESHGEWQELENLLKRAGKGSRVLITSRSSGVFSLSSDLLYHLGRLQEDQGRLIFEKIAFTEGDSSSSLQSRLQGIGWEIVEKCEGLPLAVSTIGGLLRGNTDVSKWEKIRDNPIWMAEIPQTQAQKARILPALKLSYDYIPFYMQKCFAYCYLFPKAYVFKKEEIIKLWKGASLISMSETDKSIDEAGSNCFDILLRMSFFQRFKVHQEVCYKMHDLIHDLAQSVSSPHCLQIQDNESCDISETCRHVSLLCEQVDQAVENIIKNSEKLRTLLAPTIKLKDINQSLDQLFHNVQCLRILDLSKTAILELPRSVGKLKLLRYLNISETEIRVLPDTICSLYNLQTLKLLRCLWLSSLPKKFGKLVNLQHLELDDMFWHKCYSLPPRIGGLTSLENLHAFPVNPKTGCDISELKNMKYLTGRLHISHLELAVNSGEPNLTSKEKLKELVLEWSHESSPQDEEAHLNILQSLEPHSNIEKLKISHYRGKILPGWVGSEILTNLVTLSLNHCTNCKVISLDHLPHLVELSMKGLLQIETWTEAEYKHLYRLQISNCPNLRELPRQFNHLRVLKIKKCASVKALPRTPSLMFLILIDNSELEDWNGDPVTFVNEQGQPELSGPSILSVLELKIENCPKMCRLPLLFAPQKLEIINSPLLTNLPQPQFSKRLHHLALVNCADGTLVNNIPDTSSLYSLVISKISNLSPLPQLSNLPGLKSLYIHYCDELVSLSHASLLGLTALSYLSIRGCSKLTTLVDTELPTSVAVLSIDSCNTLMSLGSDNILKNLTSLKDLNIENCQDLKALPEGGLPISLQHLCIKGCPLLLKDCQENSGMYWPLIKDIPDLEIIISPEESTPANTKTSKKKMRFPASSSGYH